MGRRSLTFAVAFALVLLSLPVGSTPALAVDGGSGTVSLTTIGAPSTESFDTLANTPDAFLSNVLPTGWMLSESGTSARNDGKYAVGTGSSNTGDHYAFGTPVGNADRALGELRSGTLVPIFGASFTNNTGTTFNQLDVAYTGEQWRLGAVRTAPNRDHIDFQYSLDATSLGTGTWIDVDALDFASPVTTGTVGLLNGNLAANRTPLAGTIVATVPPGGAFWIRWTDFDVSSSDDGMAVDDFSITPRVVDSPPFVTATVPALGATNVPATSNVSVTFSEPVSIASPWSTISCATSGAHSTLATNGGPTTYVIDPTPDFSGGEQCTVTVLASAVTDQDAPPDHMTADYTLLFTVTVPPLAVHDVQGNGLRSPFENLNVTTTGVVTAVKTNGFFLQTPDADADADPATSEGVFVFTSSAPPATAAVGNQVQVSAKVQEFVPSGDPFSPPATELITPVVTSLSSGNPLPAAVTLTSANFDPAGGISQLERFEGMRVHVATVNVISPTGGPVSETNATSTNNGIFYAVLPGTARPFREPGIQIPETNPPAGTTATHIPSFDANPERIRVDSSGLGAAKLDVTTGAVVSDLTGPLDFVFRSYTVFLTSPATVTQSGITQSLPVRLPLPYEFTIASANMERFFDTVDDPGVGDVVLTATAFNNRLNKASIEIRDVLHMPDIVGVEEVENLFALQALANKINADASATGPNPGYIAYLVEGNDVGGIDSGFLVKSSRVNVIDVVQYGKDTTFVQPDGATALLNDRPPLVLRATIQPALGSAFAVTVIVNHLRSLSGINGSDGARIRAKRRAQAEFLANLVQGFQTADPNAPVISVGDYNAFQFNDGYVDVIGTVKGTPTPADNVTLASPDLVNPDLIDVVDTVLADQRYSFMFDGNAQEIDHVLITQNLVPRFVELQYGRNNADFSEAFRNDANRPERISDHDPIVAYFTFPDQPPAISAPADVTTFTGAGATSCAMFVSDAALGTATATDDRPGVQIQRSGVPTGNLFPVGTTTVTYTATDSDGNSATATQTVTVIDNSSPAISAPADLVRGTGPGSTVAGVFISDSDLGLAIASDNCAVGAIARSGVPASNLFPLGTTAITYTASDLSGNSASAVQTVTVIDNTPPTITAPANVALGTGPGALACGAFVSDAQLGSPTVSDNSGSFIVERSAVPSGSVFPIGTTTITYTATDPAGNSASATQTVTVTDNTPPTISAPSDAAYQALSQVPAANASDATAADNCGAVNVTVSESSNGGAGSPASPLVLVRTYTATDANGNIAQAAQTITVIDDTAPTISGAPTTAANANGWYNAPVTVHFTCADNVGVTSCGPDATLAADGAGQSATGTAGDAAGNTTTTTVSGINIDQNAPIVTFTGATSYTVDQNVSIDCSIIDALSGLDLGQPHHCDTASGPASGFGLGAHTLTAAGTDRAGNIGTGAVTFTVSADTSSLCQLTRSFSASAAIADSLCAKLDAAAASRARGNTTAHDNQIQAFINEVNAQRGKAITDANATTLIALAGTL